MATERHAADLQKPFIRWTDFGYEGWSPMGFDTLKEALEADSYGSRWVVTKRVEWSPVETVTDADFEIADHQRISRSA